CYAQQRTAPKPSETARERSRASTAASEVTGHGVAPFGNNTRPCLKPSETGWAGWRGRGKCGRMGVCSIPLLAHRTRLMPA
ncbi:MAG: hypothetical protein LBD24_03470, partial [Spirochaetaceae bacterium]|nr:hypothetical protein [Spirochaetaceae bacterium]